MSTALVLVAVAVLLGTGRPGASRLRGVPEPATGPVPVLRTAWLAAGAVAVAVLGWALVGPAAGIAAGIVAGGAGGVARSRLDRPRAPATDGTALAAAWELLDVCLRAGMPVSAALAAAAAPLDGSAGTALRRVAGLLELGAPAVEAWRGSGDVPGLAVLARAASRSAATGSALAQVAAGESARLRAELVDSAQARAQRAGVLVTGPLGLCFLPAFLVLGIAPVVVGLAGEALARW
jgi:Flp pilus assembly protein TadB